MAPYARVEVAVIGLLGVIATSVLAWLAGWWALLAALPAAALLSFYRDPPRRVPRRADVLLSPADGRVIRIEAGERDAETDATRLRIVIFLSVFNVHINRAPCAGRVTTVEHRPGEFLNALKPEATQRNEYCRATLESDPPLPGPIVVRQIAGLLAKRIVCRLRPGERVAAGQRYGMIKLGSQTELSAPSSANWKLCVAVGARVRAGETVLAEWIAADAPPMR